MNTVFRSLHCMVAGTALLFCTSTYASDPGLRFNDNFSSPGNWADFSKPHSTLTVTDGVLRVSRNEGNFSVAEQPVSVRPAARWRATVDLNFTDHAADDKKVRGGISLSGPLGDGLYVMLDTEGDVVVFYHNGKEWVDNEPLPYTRATAAKLGKNQKNTVSIERESGYFRIYVNGEHVGRTRIIDFTPRKVGIVLSSAGALTAEFDNLRLDELGIDTRFSRLINNDGTPGAQDILIDYFDRNRGQEEQWWVGEDETTFAEVRDGHYRLKYKDEDSSTWVTGEANTDRRTPIDPYITEYSGYQVSALITPEEGDDESGKGIVAVGTKTEQDTYYPYVALQVSRQYFKVVHRDGSGNRHSLTEWIETPSLDPKGPNRLNLTVLPDGRMLVFLNSDYQMAVETPQYFRMSNVGVFISGKQTIIVDEFYAREI